MTTQYYIDFYKKRKQLHNEMCKAIAALMKEHGVKEIDLSSTNADNAFFSHEKYGADSLEELKVNKVVLDEDGDVYVTTDETLYEEQEFYLTQNINIVLCSIETIYESVYQVLEQGN